MKKTDRLRQLLLREELTFLMDAHNALSAKIVEEAGFDGIWASGLALSASKGVRDHNELSWTQVLDEVELMADMTDVPILLDGDSGHGNFNNVRRLVRKAEQRGVAGLCIEDKLYPKTNSFLRDGRFPLATMSDFVGKIRAATDARRDDAFCIVARTEGLIVGEPVARVLDRAYGYREAGADAILVHSRRSDPQDVFAFLERWDERCPIVLVPTKYETVPAAELAARGASTIIWANHLLRAAIQWMQRTAAQVHRTQSVASLRDAIAPLEEIFRLQNEAELVEAEKKYL